MTTNVEEVVLSSDEDDEDVRPFKSKTSNTSNQATSSKNLSSKRRVFGPITSKASLLKPDAHSRLPTPLASQTRLTSQTITMGVHRGVGPAPSISSVYQMPDGVRVTPVPKGNAAVPRMFTQAAHTARHNFPQSDSRSLSFVQRARLRKGPARHEAPVHNRGQNAFNREPPKTQRRNLTSVDTSQSARESPGPPTASTEFNPMIVGIKSLSPSTRQLSKDAPVGAGYRRKVPLHKYTYPPNTNKPSRVSEPVTSASTSTPPPPLIEIDMTPPKEYPDSPRFPSKSSVHLTPRKVASIHKKSFGSESRDRPRTPGSAKVNAKDFKDRYDAKNIAKRRRKKNEHRLVQPTLKDVFPVPIPLGWRDDGFFDKQSRIQGSPQILTPSSLSPPKASQTPKSRSQKLKTKDSREQEKAPSENITEVSSTTETMVREAQSTSTETSGNNEDPIPAPISSSPTPLEPPSGPTPSQFTLELPTSPSPSTAPNYSNAPDTSTPAETNEATPSRKRKLSDTQEDGPLIVGETPVTSSESRGNEAASKKPRRVKLTTLSPEEPTSPRPSDDILEIGIVERSDDVVVVKRRRRNSDQSGSATDYSESDSVSSESENDNEAISSANDFMGEANLGVKNNEGKNQFDLEQESEEIRKDDATRPEGDTTQPEGEATPPGDVTPQENSTVESAPLNTDEMSTVRDATASAEEPTSHDGDLNELTHSEVDGTFQSPNRDYLDSTMEDPEDVDECVGVDGLEKVVNVAKVHLKEDERDLLRFTRLNFDKADPDFTASHKFGAVVAQTVVTMEKDPTQIFVHLKDFVTHLKRNKLKIGKKQKFAKEVDSEKTSRESSPFNLSDTARKTVEASKKIAGIPKILKLNCQQEHDTTQTKSTDNNNDVAENNETSENPINGECVPVNIGETFNKGPEEEHAPKKGLVVGGKKELGKSTGGSQKQLHQLYRLLEKLEMEILRLEEKELGLDDLKDSNSSHIQEAKLKLKAVKVWQAICKKEKRDPEDIGRVTKRKFCYKGSRFKEINRAISRYVTRTHEFPDFGGVQRLVKQANEKYNLNMRPNNVYDTAKSVFQDVGELLQARRHTDFVVDFGCPLIDEFREQHGSEDPANTDAYLAAKLDENAKIAKKRTDEVFVQFVKRQEENRGFCSVMARDSTAESSPRPSTSKEAEGIYSRKIKESRGDEFDQVNELEEDAEEDEDEEKMEEKETLELAKSLDEEEEDEDDANDDDNLIRWKL